MANKKITLMITSLLLLSILGVSTIYANNDISISLQTKSYKSVLTFWERVQLFFTFKEENKLIIIATIAEKRNNEGKPNSIEKRDLLLDKINSGISKGLIKSESARLKLINRLNSFAPLPDEKDEKKTPPIPPIIVTLPGETTTMTIPTSENIKDRIFCTMNYAPVCGEITTTECTGTTIKPADPLRTSSITNVECKKQTQIKTFPNKCVAEFIYKAKILYEGICKDVIKPPITITPPTIPPTLECENNKQCYDIKRSCYTQCIKEECVDIQTFVPLPPYPYCENEVEKPIPPMTPPIAYECKTTQDCIDSHKSCSVICKNNICQDIYYATSTIINPGRYPDCSILPTITKNKLNQQSFFE